MFLLRDYVISKWCISLGRWLLVRNYNLYSADCSMGGGPSSVFGRNITTQYQQKFVRNYRFHRLFHGWRTPQRVWPSTFFQTLYRKTKIAQPKTR